MTDTRQMHINLNMLNAGIYAGAWRHPDSDPRAYADAQHYVHYGRLCEAACLDAIFLADGPQVAAGIRYRPFYSLDPTVVLAAVAAATERIGLICTASTGYNEPYNIARRLLTLDRLSGGRVGWNVVTTSGDIAAQNFGLQRAPAHASRYRRAWEFVEVVQKLWRSFPEDAVIGDQESGEFVDVDRIHEIDHVGEHFRVRGPLNVSTSPQGYPVIVQAGASEDGKRFAAGLAEAVFTVAKTLEDGQARRSELKQLAREAGRNPDHVVVLPGLSTVIGSTEVEARERLALMEELVHPGYALPRLAYQLGVDASELPLDEPLPAWLDDDERSRTTAASEGFRASAIGYARRESLTVRQLVRTLGGSYGHHVVCGTPEQVADTMQLWFESGAADGFNVSPDAIQGGTEPFVSEVVPILQRRGLFRREYTGRTLRSHLGLPLPDGLTGDPDARSVTAAA